jgi:predicted MFS family arabinose efflux permease
MGVGMFVLVPVIQYGISHWGWRNAFLLLSVLGGVLLFPVTLLLLRNRPGNEQSRRNGPGAKFDKDATGQKPSAPETGFYSIVRIKTFWYFVLFGFCASVGVYIILVHSVKFLVSEGTPPMIAATVFALVGAISSLFRIIWGWVSDRMGREFAYTLGTTSTCLGIGCLLLRHVSGLEAFNLLFAVFFGIGWGATAPSIMASSADIFDGRQYGFIFGLIQAVVNLGGACGAWLGGALYENSQSYDVAFSLAIIAFALSCLFIWKAAPRRGFTSASTLRRVAQPDRLGSDKTI